MTSYFDLQQLYPYTMWRITPKYSPKNLAIEDPLCV